METNDSGGSGDDGYGSGCKGNGSNNIYGKKHNHL